MQTRTLGKGGLDVSAIGYGCMGLEIVYGPVIDRHEGVRIIRAAFERGVTHFDAARLIAMKVAASPMGVVATRYPESPLIGHASRVLA